MLRHKRQEGLVELALIDALAVPACAEAGAGSGQHAERADRADDGGGGGVLHLSSLCTVL